MVVRSTVVEDGTEVRVTVVVVSGSVWRSTLMQPERRVPLRVKTRARVVLRMSESFITK